MGYGNFGGGGGFNIQNLMKQAQKMSENMQVVRDEIDHKEFSATSGGGMVSVTLTGNKVLQKINIKPEVIDPDDKEMLEDLIKAAINDAITQINKEEKEKLPQMPTGM